MPTRELDYKVVFHAQADYPFLSSRSPWLPIDNNIMYCTVASCAHERVYVYTEAQSHTATVYMPSAQSARWFSNLKNLKVTVGTSLYVEYRSRHMDACDDMYSSTFVQIL